MIKSSSKVNINWENFESPKFKPHKFHKNTDFESCGTTIFSLITGEHPSVVDYRYNIVGEIGWGTDEFAKRLRSRGYKVITVAKNNVTRVTDGITGCTRCWNNRPLKTSHVLVINGAVMNHENSMFLLHKNKLWHHFEQIPIDPMFFLNKPTQDVLLIYHPKWS